MKASAIFFTATLASVGIGVEAQGEMSVLDLTLPRQYRASIVATLPYTSVRLWVPDPRDQLSKQTQSAPMD